MSDEAKTEDVCDACKGTGRMPTKYPARNEAADVANFCMMIHDNVV